MKGARRFRVEWTETAAADLGEIIDHLALDNPGLALQVLREFRQRARTLESLPLRGRTVPELQAKGVTLYRELIRNPWRIIYRVTDAEVYVVTVCDSRRNLEDLLLDRFLRTQSVESR